MIERHNDGMVILYEGDCASVLAELAPEDGEDGWADAIITDPPYGLSNTDPKHVAETITRWASGDRDYVPEGRGFMGKAWDAFVPPLAVWDECMRILKPGGHMLVFAGTRTMDLMTLSIRLAGFEMRDSIAWLYGSGFPKSMNVATAVDKLRAPDRRLELLPSEEQFCAWMRDFSGVTVDTARRVLGSTRFITGQVEIVNTATVDSPRMSRRAMVPTAAAWAKVRPMLAVMPPEWIEALVKAPPIPESLENWNPGKGKGTTGNNEWQGWGTALKPAFEPIVVARKPLDRVAKTVAANVLAHGTGAINIDACRVGTDVRVNAPAGNKPGGASLNMSVVGMPQNAESTTATGRWPTNVVLDESQAAELDRQSGVSNSPAKVTRGGKRQETPCYGDSGGASRFFPTFKYQAKAPAKERPKYWSKSCNCETVKPCPSHPRDTTESASTDATSWNTIMSGSKHTDDLCHPATTSTMLTKTSSTTTPTTSSLSPNLSTNESIQDANCETESGGNPANCADNSSPYPLSIGTSVQKDGRSMVAADPATSDGWSATSVCANCGNPAKSESHATVKPLELMRWLVRLVTPPEGIVVDPFAGSGTTVEAAVLESMQVVGIEAEPTYIPLIQQRIERSTDKEGSA